MHFVKGVSREVIKWHRSKFMSPFPKRWVQGVFPCPKRWVQGVDRPLYMYPIESCNWCGCTSQELRFFAVCARSSNCVYLSINMYVLKLFRSNRWVCPVHLVTDNSTRFWRAMISSHLYSLSFSIMSTGRWTQTLILLPHTRKDVTALGTPAAHPHPHIPIYGAQHKTKYKQIHERMTRPGLD